MFQHFWLFANFGFFQNWCNTSTNEHTSYKAMCKFNFDVWKTNRCLFCCDTQQWRKWSNVRQEWKWDLVLPSVMLCETWWEVLCNPVGGCFGPTSGTKRALCCMVSAKTRQCYLRPASISCLPLRPPWPLESPRLVLLFPPTALSKGSSNLLQHIFFH